jgi:prepilin-type N-terminal cleavage/methylation domain-containing protein
MLNKIKRGFTLIEVMIVILIIGLLGAFVAPSLFGYVENATATTMGESVKRINAEIQNLTMTHRVARCASGNPLANTNNTMLDVIYHGTPFVATAYQARFGSSPFSVFKSLYSETTAAASGSSAGVYQIEGSTLSIVACASIFSSNYNGYQLTNVSSDVVRAMLTKALPAATFSAGVALTTGVFRYTAAVAGMHTVTIYLPQ